MKHIAMGAQLPQSQLFANLPSWYHLTFASLSSVRCACARQLSVGYSGVFELTDRLFIVVKGLTGYSHIRTLRKA